MREFSSGCDFAERSIFPSNPFGALISMARQVALPFSNVVGKNCIEDFRNERDSDPAT